MIMIMKEDAHLWMLLALMFILFIEDTHLYWSLIALAFIMIPHVGAQPCPGRLEKVKSKPKFLLIWYLTHLIS
jgi:hypothetical protein